MATEKYEQARWVEGNCDIDKSRNMALRKIQLFPMFGGGIKLVIIKSIIS